MDDLLARVVMIHGNSGRNPCGRIVWLVPLSSKILSVAALAEVAIGHQFRTFQILEPDQAVGASHQRFPGRFRHFV
jgi:hypothetical protein